MFGLLMSLGGAVCVLYCRLSWVCCFGFVC